MIYDIQRYCLHDGRGIRTTVFFKGCQCACPWCANPESLSPLKQLAYARNKCTLCDACVRSCPTGARERRDTVAHERCTLCGACEYVCQSDAIKLYGYEIDAEELAGILAKDRRFYRRSNGGVTVSGGEPTLQVSYLTKLLKSLRERGIHTAIETNGDFPAEVRDVLVSYVDQFLIDLKHMNAASHERATGRGNECIIQNLTALADKDTVIRIPLIPGFNDDEVNLKACAQFAASLGLPVHLLKFHAMAASKYETLGMNYAYAGRTSYSDDALDAIARIFAEEGVNACIGGGEEASPRPAFYRT